MSTVWLVALASGAADHDAADAARREAVTGAGIDAAPVATRDAIALVPESHAADEPSARDEPDEPNEGIEDAPDDRDRDRDRGRDRPPTEDQVPETNDRDGPTPSSPALASSGCAEPSPGPGLHDLELELDGTVREYALFIPDTYDPATPASLVLNFHGFLGRPSRQIGFSELNGYADDRGMIVAYPAGLGASFNGGQCCGRALNEDVDDVAFARAVVEDAASQLCIDPSRIYATGMSNGGHMAHRLACESADLFAAVASVTGVLGLDPEACAPERPISVLQFHGTADPIVPYSGNRPGYPEVPVMMADWAARNGCAATPVTTVDEDDVHCETWPGCNDGVEVTLCTVDEGGHCWPGNRGCTHGRSTTDVHASAMITKMFDAQEHPDPAPLP